MALGSVGWGAAAGAIGATAVLAFYTALQRGSTAVVAPVAGCGVVIPVLAGLVNGEAVGWRAGGGVLAAILGVLIVAAAAGDDETAPQRAVGVRGGLDGASRAERGRPPPRQTTPARAQPVPAYDGCVPPKGSRSARSSVVLAAGSALGFGAFFVILERATTAAIDGTDTGILATALVVAIAVQGGSLAVTLLAATRHTRACLQPGRTLLIPALAVGVLDVVADICLTVAVGSGPLAVVGPLGSLAPVVTVLIATVVLRQRVRRLPAMGIVVALLGITLIASD